MSNEFPSSFEEFSEARKNGFINAKKVKDEGGLIAGTFCTFTPAEIFDAAGIKTVSLCGTSDETIAAAETQLPKNLCPLIKSSYGFALTDKCPYTYFSDIIVGETTCDGKKKMYELLGKKKNVYVMQLPQATDREWALPMWVKELERLRDSLQEQFGMKITDEKLREACALENRFRRARLGLMELQKLTPPPAFGKNMYKVLDGASFNFDKEAAIQSIEQMTEQIRSAYEAGERPVSADAKRILVTGCPITGVLEKTIGTIEDNGGVVVCLENCGGIKPVRRMVDEKAEDIMTAIAERYLQIGCAVMTPNTRRLEMLPELFEEFRIDGVVEVILQSCHPYSVERYSVRSVAEECGIPYMSVETDFSQSDAGQLSTRLSAFIEML